MSYLLKITSDLLAEAKDSELGLKAHTHWSDAVHNIAAEDPRADTAWGHEVALEGAFYGTPKVYLAEVSLSEAELESLKEWGFKPHS